MTDATKPDLGRPLEAVKLAGANALGILLREASLAFIDEQTKGALAATDRELLSARLEYRCATFEPEDEGNQSVSSPLAVEAITALLAADPKRSRDDAYAVLVWRSLFAHYWPGVFAKWQKDKQENRVTRVPAIMSLKVGSLYSRKLPSGTEVAPTLNSLGQLVSVTITRNGAQLHLDIPASRSISNPSNDEVSGLIASSCTPAEWRMFMAVWVGASDDYAAGRTTVFGGYLHTPGRMARLLGVKDRDAIAAIDARFESLQQISVTVTTKRGGKPYELKGAQLIIDGKGTVTPATGGRKAGRPTARLFRIQDTVLGLLDNGGAWFPLTERMLRPPPNIAIRPRDWDDAFKLLTVLYAYARMEPKKANKPGMPWRRKVALLLNESGITSNAREARRLEQLRALLDLLQADKRITYRWTEDKGGPWVEYDVPPDWKEELKEIPSRKALKSLGR